MSTPRTSNRSTAARIAVVVGLVSSLFLTSRAPAEAAAAGLTPSTGGALTTQVVALSGTGFANAAGTSQVLPPGATTYGVSFASGTCAADAAAGHTANQIDATAIAVASPTRLIVTVPGGAGGLPDTTLGTGLETKKEYQLCVYSATATGGVYKLMTSAKYTVYPRPTLAATRFMSLSSGPSTGGQAVTVIGDTSATTSATASGYFSSKTTATIGGVPLVGIKVAKDGNSFTAVTPAVPAGTADLVVTTEGGSVTQADGYTSTNAVTVSPALISPLGGSVLTVKGKGFNAIKDASNFGVTFYTGTYDSSSNSGTLCTNVQIVSDVELVCTTPELPVGAHNVMVTDDTSGSAAEYTTVPSSGSTVTVGGF